MSMSDVGAANNIIGFAKMETTFGTLVKPAVTDGFLIIGDPSNEGERDQLEDEQHRPGASEVQNLLGKFNEMTWSFQAYLKPSGSAGTAPELDVLLEAAMGSKTAAGTVKYNLAGDLPSFTLWLKDDHTMFCLPGSLVESMEIVGNAPELVKVTFNGKSLKKYWAGTADGSLASAVFTCSDTNAGKRFKEGAFVVTDSDDNGGAGFEITGISGDAITLASAPSGGTTLSPWYPGDVTEVGSPVLAKLGQATIEGENWDIMTSTVTLTNNTVYYNEEKNNSLYPTSAGRPGKRAVSASFGAYYHRQNTEFFDHQENATPLTIILPFGNASGSIVKLTIPKSGSTGGLLVSSPKPNGSPERKITIDGRIIGSDGSDEFELEFL